MKLQKLTIHNIASFKDAEIDFEKQPLADSDVFLITGKTGAGKSTILDAICLALYADTPRLYNTKMQGATEKIDDEKSVQIDDPRQLMRKNTGEANVVLTFTGSNGVRYQATWEVHRADKKTTGRLQSKKWELKNLDTDTTITKDAEIKNEINAAIGLDFSQFCRTTMLAQGEFTRFLNSPDNEKAEILEKVTGVDAYSRIGKKIFVITGQKENEYKEADKAVKDVKTLSDDDLSKKNEELEQVKVQVGELRKERESVTVRRQWIHTECELRDMSDKALEEYKKAKNVIDSDGFKDKERLVKDWKDTIEARSKLAELDKMGKQKSAQENKLAILSEEYVKLLEGQLYSKEELQKLEGDKTAVDAYIKSHESKKDVYERAQAIAGQLGTIATGRKSIAGNETARREKENTLNDIYVPFQTKAANDVLTAKDNLEKKESELQRKEEELAGLDLPTLRSKRDAAKELLGNIDAAKEKIEALGTAIKAIQIRRNQLDKLKSQIDNNQKASGELSLQIHDAETTMDVCKDILDRQRDTVDKFAKDIRSRLKIGDTCPVCRQKISAALPPEAELSALVDGLQRQYDEAKKKHDDLVEKKRDLDAGIRTDTESYNIGLEAVNNDTTVADAEEKAIAACRKCDIDAIDDSTLSSLDSLKTAANDTLAQINGTITSGESMEKVVCSIRKEIKELQKSKEKADEALNKANKNVDNCKSEIKTIQSLIDSKKIDVSSAEDIVGSLLTGNSWNIDWYQKPEDFGSALINAANGYNSKVREQTRLENSIKAKIKEIEDVANALNAVIDAMPVWKELSASSAGKVDGLLGMASGLGQKLANVKALLDSAEKTIKDDKDWLDVNNAVSTERLKELSGYDKTQIDGKDSSLRKDKENAATKKTELDVAQNAFDEHNRKKPPLNDGDTVSTLDARLAEIDSKINGLNQHIGSINKEIKDDADSKQKLGGLEQVAKDKKALYEKWSQLNKLLGDADGNKFRRIAQSYVLANLIHSANSYMATLTDRYILKVIPGTFVISVEDAYQGYASRAASTISGGESFLVSLSLALALSDIGQNLSVDTIFIDEGFGTLSGEPLQNAIETLRSLHTKAGRHVGIISHVEELQEKIPVQIQVCQDNKTSSSMIHVVPDSVRQINSEIR